MNRAVLDPEQPDRFVLGIEFDGRMVHSASTTRDRDRLRQQVLEGLGWTIHRIWSRDWIQNKKLEVEKVLQAVSDAKNGVSVSRLPSAKKKLVEENTVTTPIELGMEANGNQQGPPGTVPYQEKQLSKQVNVGGDAFLNTPHLRVADAFKAIIDAEGPISISVAKERVLAAWNTRRGVKIDMHLDAGISQGRMQNKFMIKGNFLWPSGMSVPPLRVHAVGKPLRSLDEIPPEEIMLGMVICVRNALGIHVDDLARETLRLFGLIGTRDNSLFMDEIMQKLISADVLNIENNKISLGKKPEN